MLYSNNSEAAILACERDRTGNYGLDDGLDASMIDTSGTESIYGDIARAIIDEIRRGKKK